MGLEPGQPRRQLEQRRDQLPLGQSLQERAGQPQLEPRLPSRKHDRTDRGATSTDFAREHTVVHGRSTRAGALPDEHRQRGASAGHLVRWPQPRNAPDPAAGRGPREDSIDDNPICCPHATCGPVRCCSRKWRRRPRAGRHLRVEGDRVLLNPQGGGARRRDVRASSCWKDKAREPSGQAAETSLRRSGAARLGWTDSLSPRRGRYGPSRRLANALL